MSIKNILVVDDSKSARLVLAKLLKNHNLEVAMVESGEEALEYLRSNHPDAIFMDHMMKGMDGLQTTQAIKSNSATASIPIAMYTSQNGDDYLANVRRHGAVGLLQKPPNSENLTKVMELLENAAATASSSATTPATAAAVSQAAGPMPSEAVIKQLIEQSLEAAINKKIVPLLERRLGEVRDDIIAISQTNTDLALENSLHAHIFPKLEERTTELRKFTVNTSEATAEALLKQALEKQIAPALTRKFDDFGQALSAKHEKAAHEIATTVSDEQLQKFAAQIGEQLDTKLGALQVELAQPRKIDQESFQDLQDKASRKAGDAARSAAESTARQVAQQSLAEVGDRLRSANARALLFAVLAALVGIGAAAAVFVLK